MVFTLKLPTKDKDKKLFREKCELLEPLDIKVIDKFDSKETTHVVSNKRNTPQTLQALVHAKYVVDDSVLKELEYVTTEDNLDEPESMSRLELDFDGSWPDPLKFLPAANREPVPRSETYFKPDGARRNVFNGYTFIIFDKKQYDSLQPAIVGGGGRAKLHELKLGKSTSTDIVRIMKNEFEAAESRMEGSGYGVLHVRLNIADPAYEDWAIQIQTESVTDMRQGLVEQNEFLDAILTKDARGLVKKIDISADSATGTTVNIVSGWYRVIYENEADHRTGRTRSPNESRGSSIAQQRSQTRLHHRTSEPSSHGPTEQAQDSATMNINSLAQTRAPQIQEEEQATAATGRSRRIRGTTARAFQGFVDDPFEPETPSVEHVALQEDEKTSTPEPQPRSMDVDELSAIGDEDIIFRSPRKRPLPPDLESGEDINAKLYPAQAAAKKRKIEAAETIQHDATIVPQQEPVEKDKKVMKANREINYEAPIRNLREKQEVVKDEDLEPMHNQLGKMTFAEKQSLAKIQEFEVKPRNHKLNKPEIKDTRWNEEWNGRKNFKGFVKRGQSATPRNGPRVIIATEPIRVESATEQYLASKQTEPERRNEKSKEEAIDPIAESEISQEFTDANTHQEEVPAELLNDGGPEVIDVDAPRTTRGMDKVSSAPSRTRTTAASLKRQASTTTTGPTKKNRKFNLRIGDDEASSEEDEIPKFSFKKK